MAPRNLYLIRHAECRSIALEAHDLVPADEHNGLTVAGWQQAEALGTALSRRIRTPLRLIASDLRRAEETASIVARALGAQVEHDQRLRERDFGNVAHLSLTELRVLQELAHEKPHERIQEGESVAQHFDRAKQALEELLRADQRDLVVVAHGGTLDCLQLHLYGSNADGAAHRYTACGPAHFHHWQLQTLARGNAVACLLSVNSSS